MLGVFREFLIDFGIPYRLEELKGGALILL